ncbi:UNVERIFIED_ORG: hypothetical protein J2W66_004418 [Agrobacterium larrymoorei]|nr:hypothetical protein [Agrobacterium larrymoorei]
MTLNDLSPGKEALIQRQTAATLPMNVPFGNFVLL